MQTKCIIFDMDGLMIDSEKLSYSIIKSIIAEQGHDVSLDLYAQTIGVCRGKAEKLYSNTFPGVDGKQVFQMYFPRYFNALKTGHLEAKPGLIPLLQELDRRGIRRAVASSNDKAIVEASLKNIGVYDRMDAHVYAEMVERVKPSPDLFLKAAALLGVKPEECLVLEDSKAGVEAAVAANIPVILIPDMIPPTEHMLKVVLRKYDTLYDVIDYIKAHHIGAEASNY